MTRSHHMHHVLYYKILWMLTETLFFRSSQQASISLPSLPISGSATNSCTPSTSASNAWWWMWAWQWCVCLSCSSVDSPPTAPLNPFPVSTGSQWRWLWCLCGCGDPMECVTPSHADMASLLQVGKGIPLGVLTEWLNFTEGLVQWTTCLAGSDNTEELDSSTALSWLRVDESELELLPGTSTYFTAT